MPVARRILLVEDEALLLEVTRADLEDMGFETTCARDGAAALETLRSSGPFDGLVTDIRMPGEIDGWRLAALAREAAPDLPVIYVSGYSSQDMAPVDGGGYSCPNRSASPTCAGRLSRSDSNRPADRAVTFAGRFENTILNLRAGSLAMQQEGASSASRSAR